ncbi:hypothetical protein NLJ89_g3099 [Agrocybe chaxingu]|uniref:Uncharacterized protein n=1 Tax=Agrocybe chaxingu TaxID=84603 RepID=A0A9W8MVT7_9AGAR|nr:hypothetical protein NLJ89_g3099 [Agrocybe chaxingu]
MSTTTINAFDPHLILILMDFVGADSVSWEGRTARLKKLVRCFSAQVITSLTLSPHYFNADVGHHKPVKRGAIYVADRPTVRSARGDAESGNTTCWISCTVAPAYRHALMEFPSRILRLDTQRSRKRHRCSLGSRTLGSKLPWCKILLCSIMLCGPIGRETDVWDGIGAM